MVDAAHLCSGVALKATVPLAQFRRAMVTADYPAYRDFRRMHQDLPLAHLPTACLLVESVQNYAGPAEGKQAPTAEDPAPGDRALRLSLLHLELQRLADYATADPAGRRIQADQGSSLSAQPHAQQSIGMILPAPIATSASDLELTRSPQQEVVMATVPASAVVPVADSESQPPVAALQAVRGPDQLHGGGEYAYFNTHHACMAAFKFLCICHSHKVMESCSIF